MTAYLIGNVAGRLVLSYAIIWLAMWGFAKLSWRDAFRRTNRWMSLTAIATLFLLGLIAAQSAHAAQRAGRPMIIHRLPALGLEIWTEHDPEWETHLQERSGGAATFFAETPALTYPPAHMSWTTLPQFRFDPREFQASAEGALHQIAADHQVRSPKQLRITPQQYGDLIGYETTFEAHSQNIPIEVHAFCGHRPGKQPVLMQVTTLKSKATHLAEHIRRSWGNVRYLP